MRDNLIPSEQMSLQTWASKRLSEGRSSLILDSSNAETATVRYVRGDEKSDVVAKMRLNHLASG